MPGKYGSASVWFLVDGYDVLTAKVKSLAVKLASKLEGTTGLGDTWDEHTPVGRSSVTLTQAGAFFDTNTAGIHAGFSGSVPTSPQATERIICVGLAGNTIGAPFIGLQGAFSGEYEVLAENDALTKANVGYTITGKCEQGVVLQEREAKTGDWNTKTGGEAVDTTTLPQRVWAISSITSANPAVITSVGAHGLTTGDKVLISGSNSGVTVDGDRAVTVISSTTFSVAVNNSGAAGTSGSFVVSQSQNGAAGYLQVTAFSGFTGFVAKVQDSADDVTYADLVTFTDVTSGPTAQRVAVSGQVDRYLSVDGNITGSGSVTSLVGLCRF